MKLKKETIMIPCDHNKQLLFDWLDINYQNSSGDYTRGHAIEYEHQYAIYYPEAIPPVCYYIEQKPVYGLHDIGRVKLVNSQTPQWIYGTGEPLLPVYQQKPVPTQAPIYQPAQKENKYEHDTHPVITILYAIFSPVIGFIAAMVDLAKKS